MMPISIDKLLDIGFDYGAHGGPDDFGTTLVRAYSGRTAANVPRSQDLGEWQLGNRNIDAVNLKKLRDFWNSVRGTALLFNYLDWGDHLATDEPLTVDGGSSSQLQVTATGFGNDYIKKITKPNVTTLAFKKNGTPLAVAGINQSTGVVTFNAPYPIDTDVVTWSGEFYKPARFSSTRFSAQFLAYEQRGTGRQAIYSLDSLTVTEEPA